MMVSDIQTLPELESTVKYAPKFTSPLKIEELLKKGLALTQIAKLCNISVTAVRGLIERNNIDPIDTEVYKKNRADTLASVQRRLLNNISQADIKKSGLRDKVVAVGILYDKERLERGQSTENVSIDGALRSIHSQLFALPDPAIDITPSNKKRNNAKQKR